MRRLRRLGNWGLRRVSLFLCDFGFGEFVMRVVSGFAGF